MVRWVPPVSGSRYTEPMRGVMAATETLTEARRRTEGLRIAAPSRPRPFRVTGRQGEEGRSGSRLACGLLSPQCAALLALPGLVGVCFEFQAVSIVNVGVSAIPGCLSARCEGKA